MKRNNPCSSCRWAERFTGMKTIQTPAGPITILQTGANSFHCACNTVHNITISDGEMICSNYEAKSNEKE